MNAAGDTTRYEYDGLGRRTAVIDPLGNVSRTEYDGEGRVTREIDPEGRIAEVEGMTTFEDFTDAALLKGMRPPVVPELKTITVGGAVSGLGIEASSFKHGLVHETVEEMEIL